MSEANLTIRDVKVRAVNAPLKRPLRNAMGVIPSAPLVLIDVGDRMKASPAGPISSPIRWRRWRPWRGSSRRSAATSRASRSRPSSASAISIGASGCWDGRASSAWRCRGSTWRCGTRSVRRRAGPWQSYWAARRALSPPMTATASSTRAPTSGRSRQSVDSGFRAIKIKLGDGDVARDVATVKAVRELIGPDIALMVDYNQSLDPVEAGRRIAAIAPHDIHWVEEPVRADDLEGHARVRAASPVRIQTGENWWFPRGMADAIAAGASDYVMPDVMKIGGITGWLRAAALAEAASLPMSSHIFIETSAHLLPVTPTAHWLEYLDLAGDILAEPCPLVDGQVTARGPGLGLTWDEKAVERFKV